ncbi:hypothetical protein [Actinomadura harenae]|uniref:Uncharacterized protein n=1 Tax=Actinomadura harenae TaxID=2483351 RepID=A0A3M2MEE8_9ACTN|nr:hypothetical protein [Actinomadura harenae]RMI47816.1 hypothetical protein EBO15_00515 [Actinomadura harenae]
METGKSSKAAPTNFGAIEAIVHQGKAVVSVEDSAIVEWAIKAIVERRTATLYLKPIVFQAIRKWYWTPERVESVGMKPILAEHTEKVKSDFDIEIDGNANTLDCPRCGYCYSTYEFIRQGIEEHGREVVRDTFSLKRVAILQIHPVQNLVCQNCRLHMLMAIGDGKSGGYYYDYWCGQGNAYACCQ